MFNMPSHAKRKLTDPKKKSYRIHKKPSMASDLSFKSALSSFSAHDNQCKGLVECLESNEHVRSKVQMISDECRAKSMMPDVIRKNAKKGYAKLLKSKIGNNPGKAKKVYGELVKEIEDNVAAAQREVKNLKLEAAETHGVTFEEDVHCDTDELFWCLQDRGVFVPAERLAFKQFVNTSSFGLFAAIITSRARVDESLNVDDPVDVFDRIMFNFIAPLINDQAVRPYIMLATRFNLLQMAFGAGSMPFIDRMISDRIGPGVKDLLKLPNGTNLEARRTGALFVRYLLSRSSSTLKHVLTGALNEGHESASTPNGAVTADDLAAELETLLAFDRELRSRFGTETDVAGRQALQEVIDTNRQNLQETRVALAEAGGTVRFNIMGLNVVIPPEASLLFGENNDVEMFIRYMDFFETNASELGKIAIEAGREAGKVTFEVSKDIAKLILNIGVDASKEATINAIRVVQNGGNYLITTATEAATTASGTVSELVRRLFYKTVNTAAAYNPFERFFRRPVENETAEAIDIANTGEVLTHAWGAMSRIQSGVSDDSFYSVMSVYPHSSSNNREVSEDDYYDIRGGSAPIIPTIIPQSLLKTFLEFSQYIEWAKRVVTEVHTEKILRSPELQRKQRGFAKEKKELLLLPRTHGGAGGSLPVAAGLAALTALLAFVPR